MQRTHGRYWAGIWNDCFQKLESQEGLEALVFVMQIRIRFPLRHPFFADWPATPARLAKGACTALSGTYQELARAATAGIRPSHAVFALHYPESPLITPGDRDALWEVFQVPLFALLLDGEGRLVGYECEAHDGLHIAASCPDNSDRHLISSEDSILGYRIPLERFVVENTPCECGRPGQRIRYRQDTAGKPMQICPANDRRPELMAG